MVRIDTEVTTPAAKVWSYATRTLTQAQFPFWSAIIGQTQGSANISPGSETYVNIQPPSGETWLVDLLFSTYSTSVSTYVEYFDYDGSTARRHGRFVGSAAACISVTRILTNSRYARLGGYNNSGTDTLYYGYSGFKLSQPLWSPKRAGGEPALPFKRKTAFDIPPEVKPLEKYICDILMGEKYTQAIILEEDTPLATDAKGFPVETLSAYAVVERFIELMPQIKAEPVETGYKGYLDKWREEGIAI
jgi:hypothetical protein